LLLPYKRRVDSSNPKPDNVGARKDNHFLEMLAGLKAKPADDWSGRFDLLIVERFKQLSFSRPSAPWLMGDLSHWLATVACGNEQWLSKQLSSAVSSRFT
jgi:hypothetical protein